MPAAPVKKIRVGRQLKRVAGQLIKIIVHVAQLKYFENFFSHSAELACGIIATVLGTTQEN
jgi:hypothetical protein